MVDRLGHGVRSGGCEQPLPGSSPITHWSMEMTRRLLMCALLLVPPLASYGEDKPGKLPPVPTNPAFEKMKKLAGTWLAAGEDGKPTDRIMSIIKVTAGGS